MLRSVSHPLTFEERLAEQKARLLKKAAELQPGPEQDELLRKAGQFDTAVGMSGWLKSSLRAPR